VVAAQVEGYIKDIRAGSTRARTAQLAATLSTHPIGGGATTLLDTLQSRTSVFQGSWAYPIRLLVLASGAGAVLVLSFEIQHLQVCPTCW
jgi:hypothetical protein